MLQRLLLLNACCVMGLVPTSNGLAQPMNLLIIQTDEHNFRTLGCYRNLLPEDQAFMWGPAAVVETPNIDSIAQQGAICTSFYATAPVCTPSRAALASGRYPQNTGAPTNNLKLRDDVVTFANRLQDLGYSTGYAGKWHLDGGGKPQWQPDRQFGFADNRFMFNRGHWKQLELAADGPRVKARTQDGQPSYGIEGADESSFTTDWLTDRTLEFIDAHRDEPFCYWVSIPDPHGPNTVRPPYDMMFDARDFSQPRTYDQSRDTMPRYLGSGLSNFSARGMAQYFGMVKCIDDNVGRILERLAERDLTQRTMIVFTSDHGDLCGEHHRDNKGNPYEASARVPFLLSAPGKVPAGTVLNEAMTGVDFVSTVMTLLGHKQAGEPLDGVEGRDLSPLFTTGRAPADYQDVVIMRAAGVEQGWVAAITDRYKLVLSPQEEPWLFDLELDPDELMNYFNSPDHAQTVHHLARHLAAYGPRHQDPFLRAPKMVQDLEAVLAKSQ